MDSATLFKQAAEVIPGGVNSPVRAFKSVGGSPIYFKKGEGAYLIDVEDNKYLDFCSSWGPLILGHAHPNIVNAVTETVANGLTFGACHPYEVEMAELITKQIPSMEMVRAVNSGTEATMSALRLARGYTGRRKIVKFDGCYHGHADYLLVAAGSGLLTGGISSSAGVSDQAAAEVLVVPYNDIEAVKSIFADQGDEIAAVVVEPVAGNMGLIEPSREFLQTLRDVTTESGSVLIFDEVITGFRFGPTSYGELIGIKPDLTCLGKIIGGGMPMAAFGGKREIMEKLAPLGEVYQAGTLSGNPVALAAGIATVKTLVEKNPYPEMERLAKKLADTLNEADCGVTVKQTAGLFTIFFGDKIPATIDDVKECDMDRFARFHQEMLKKGYYLSPSQYELGFISGVQTEAEIDGFIADAIEMLKAI